MQGIDFSINRRSQMAANTNRVHVVFVEAVLFTHSLSCTVYTYFTLLLTFCVRVAFVKILLRLGLKFKRNCVVMSSYCIRPSYRLSETNAIYTGRNIS